VIEAAKRFPLLEVSGSHYEMGLQHGRASKPVIERAIGVMGELLAVPHATACAYAAESIPYCREQAPELMEEMQGIADGAGLSFEEIFALNASLDLQLSGQKVQDYAGPDCWAAAVGGERTQSGGTYVLWSAEDIARWFDACILLKGQPEGGEPFLLWTFAGFVGRPGLNPHLALSAAAQWTEDIGPGMPYPLICRKALSCRTTAEAVQAISRYDRMAGMAYTIGDANGGLATLYTSARSVRVADEQPGWTACAGRWEAERIPRIAELLKPEGNTLEDLQHLQRDHGAGNLCAHDGALAVLTMFICDVNERAMWLTYGNACESEYVRYSLGAPAS
jgi:isopenicillin-N N-acyltransferase-like protein